MTDNTEVTVRAATMAAYNALEPEQRAQVRDAAKDLLAMLKASCPTIQLSLEGAIEVIGAAYAWKAAGGEHHRKAHLTTLAGGAK